MAEWVRHWRLSGCLAGVAFALGIAVYALVGPNAASIDVRVQASLLGLIGVVIAATAGLIGAGYGSHIGADAARQVAGSAAAEARADREQADRHRFTAERHRLYAILISAADAYHEAVSASKLVRELTAKGVRLSAKSLPDFVDVMRTVELIRLVAPPGAVKAARRLRVAAIALSPYGLIPPGHAAYPNDWDAANSRYLAAEREFVDAVRDDLGADSMPRHVTTNPVDLA